ncbi:MAG TPA: aldo/keto reductase [Candidatus Elarobacter sp.]|nr:aldo/keto reductase [Candidatus Elarobacter sp.]
MIARRLGAHGPEVGAIALGCMGMSEFYDPVSERDAVAAIHRALELGMTLLDTSDMYGRGENERLVGRALRGRRERAVLATKVGMVRGEDPAYRGIDNRPEYVHAACDASLARLGLDYVDVLYLHRADASVPIEETVGAMAELVAAGKVRHLGLSEVGADTLRRAAAVAPIAALQSEYSLFTRDVETNGVLAASRALGIALVAYAPLGRGILTGAVRSTAGLAEHDLRRRVPRFDPGNFERNLGLVDAFAALAHEHHASAAQLALAWLLAQGDDVVALPGCERVAQVEENARAAELALDAATLDRIDALFPPGAAAGGRLRGVDVARR